MVLKSKEILAITGSAAVMTVVAIGISTLIDMGGLEFLGEGFRCGLPFDFKNLEGEKIEINSTAWFVLSEDGEKYDFNGVLIELYLEESTKLGQAVIFVQGRYDGLNVFIRQIKLEGLQGVVEHIYDDSSGDTLHIVVVRCGDGVVKVAFVLDGIVLDPFVYGENA